MIRSIHEGLRANMPKPQVQEEGFFFGLSVGDVVKDLAGRLGKIVDFVIGINNVRKANVQLYDYNGRHLTSEYEIVAVRALTKED